MNRPQGGPVSNGGATHVNKTDDPPFNFSMVYSIDEDTVNAVVGDIDEDLTTKKKKTQ